MSPSRIEELIATTVREGTESGLDDVRQMIPDEMLDSVRPGAVLDARHLIFLDSGRESWTGSVAYLVFESESAALEAATTVVEALPTASYSMMGEVEIDASGAKSATFVSNDADGSPYWYGITILYGNAIENWLWDARDYEQVSPAVRRELVDSFVQRVQWASE